MDRNALKDCLEAKCSFTIHMNDGSTYRINHLDFLLLPSQQKSYCIAVPDSGGSLAFLSYANIAKIEFDQIDKIPIPV